MREIHGNRSIILRTCSIWHCLSLLFCAHHLFPSLRQQHNSLLEPSYFIAFKAPPLDKTCLPTRQYGYPPNRPDPSRSNLPPYTPPGENEIVVKNGAVAVNPVDWLKQAFGDLMFSWIKYPVILGSDLAGEVVEVRKGVTRFEVGDRVIGHVVGMDARSNKSAEGAFQQYTIIRANLASPIPSSVPYENACVLPLCLSTAACALFQKDFLALQYPTVSPKPNGKSLLVWGGSTSVGSNAIQLAVAAGYEVITTASPKNFEYVKRLGAIEVFD
jgi:NADPH:quinone reductase-like Zn-dependent oxidoreductase